MSGPVESVREASNRPVGPFEAKAVGNLRANRWRERWLLLGVVFAFLLAACGGGSGGVAPSASGGGSGDGSPAASEVAPDFSFTLYQGSSELGAETLNVSDLQGKPLVLNFWAGLCPPCRAEMPDLQGFYEEYKDRVTLVGVDVGQFSGLGNEDDARDLLSELGVTYPAGFTADASVMRSFKVLGMPTTVFIDPKGGIFRTWTGALNRDVLTRVTNEMLELESGPST